MFHFITQSTTKTCTWGQDLVKAAFLKASSRAFLGETGIFFFTLCVTMKDYYHHSSHHSFKLSTDINTVQRSNNILVLSMQIVLAKQIPESLRNHWGEWQQGGDHTLRIGMIKSIHLSIFARFSCPTYYSWN